MDPSTLIIENELFSQVILFAAQAGFAADVARASGICKAVWCDERLWGRLVGVLGKLGMNALMTCAATTGNTDRAQFLLGCGASANLTDEQGLTALCIACRAGHAALASLLLKRGFAVDGFPFKGGGNKTPLHYACESGDEGLVSMLLKNQADLAALGPKSRTALHFACLAGIRNTGAVRVLLASGADANATALRDDGRYEAPLHCAYRKGNAEVVRLLIEAGAGEPSAEIGWFQTPLHAACEGGNVALVKQLLDKNDAADLHSTDCVNSMTPLHVASRYGREAVVKLLLSRGANVLLEDDSGCTPAHTVCVGTAQGLPFAAHKLYIAVAGPAHAAILEMLLKHLKRESNLSASDEGVTSLMFATAESGMVACLKPLLDIGVQVDAVDDDDDERTPLLAACAAGRVEVVRALLKAGADANATSLHMRESPLHAVAWSEDLEEEAAHAIVSLLVESGADPTLEDSGHHTAWLLARQQRNAALATRLRSLAAHWIVREEAQAQTQA